MTTFTFNGKRELILMLKVARRNFQGFVKVVPGVVSGTGQRLSIDGQRLSIDVDPPDLNPGWGP